MEWEIFKKYPNSAKIRAAELQYAMALQLMLTKVTNTETWIAAAKETSRGAACIGETVPNKDLNIYDIRTEEVKNIILNTLTRKDRWERSYDFTTSYGLPNTDLCNVDLDTLPE